MESSWTKNFGFRYYCNILRNICVAYIRTKQILLRHQNGDGGLGKRLRRVPYYRKLTLVLIKVLEIDAT